MFHPRKMEYLFCTARIPLCWDKIFPCNHFSPLRQDKKVSKKYSQKYISIDRKYFYCVFTTLWRQSVRKKVNKYLCRTSLFYRSRHWKCSAKKVFLIVLQYSQENICVGVSLQAFKSAIASKRDSSAVVFLWIL